MPYTHARPTFATVDDYLRHVVEVHSENIGVHPHDKHRPWSPKTAEEREAVASVLPEYCEIYWPEILPAKPTPMDRTFVDDVLRALRENREAAVRILKGTA